MIIKKVKFPPKLLPPTIGKTYFRRVAAYARVSTDSTEQEASLEAQRDYYQQYIRTHANWQLVEIYYDNGISGLSHKKREGFNRMIADALAGKIDLIITKSISRFARNTVDTINTIRKLKAVGVEVFFEKENIYTLDSKSEFLITLLSSLAQEESRSISENITWGQRKRFADGRYCVPYHRFLGYDQGGTNQLVVNMNEAETVRLIYRLYLEGKTQAGICKYLEGHGVHSPGGKKRWSTTTVTSILANEKYKGDALLQKSYTVDFLSKKMKKNEGELPMYYVEKGHEPIISDEVFALAQEERKKRLAHGQKFSGKQRFSSKIICRECGSFYGQKIAHSNDKYCHAFWRCNSFYKAGSHSPSIHEKILHSCCQAAMLYLYDKHSDVKDLCSELLSEYAPERSTEEYRYEIERMLQEAYKQEFYDEQCWATIIDRVEVSKDGALNFYFIDGTAIFSCERCEVDTSLPRRKRRKKKYMVISQLR